MRKKCANEIRYQSCKVPLYLAGSQAAMETFSKIADSTKLNSFLLTTWKMHQVARVHLVAIDLVDFESDQGWGEGGKGGNLINDETETHLRIDDA